MRRSDLIEQSVPAVLIVVLLLGARGLLLGATPVIKDFSSTGGDPQNKTGPKDRMYLVKPGDKITFTVKAEDVGKYQWQVNKKVQDKTVGKTFVWTVPDEKGIWEIHLKATGGGKQAHEEWVVSTLSKKEAPDFFDYFTDKKTLNRSKTDPWGRDLPEWTGSVMDAAGQFLKSKKGGGRETISHSSTTAYGTWKFRYRFPDGNEGVRGKVFGCFGFTYLVVGAAMTRTAHHYGECHDTHHHCVVSKPTGKWFSRFSMEYDGGGAPKDKDWYEVTIVRTPDNWVRAYCNGIFEMHVCEKVPTKCEKIEIHMATYSGGIRPVYFDSLEIYRDKYLFPDRSIEYGDYVANMKEKGHQWDHALYSPVKQKGIVLNGRGIRLSDIAAVIDKRYFKKTGENTYTCYTNLIVDDGAELIIKDETLKFHCTRNGQCQFGQNFGSRLHIENSTITSDSDHYFTWNNCAPDTHFAHKQVIGSRVARGVIYRSNTHDISGYFSFVAKNSIIRNTTKMYFDSPYVMRVTNTRFENMCATDTGMYAKRPGTITKYKESIKGKKSFWVVIDDLNVHDFTLRGLTFRGKEPPEVTFLVNAHRDRLNIYDVDVGGGKIVLKDVPLPNENQSHGWLPYRHLKRSDGGGPSWIDGRLGLVNCRFRDIVIAATPGKDCNAYALPKYYLDAKVTNPDGSPVSGAKVSVDIDRKIGTLASGNRKYTPGWSPQSVPKGCGVSTVFADREYSPENMEVRRIPATGKFDNFYHHYRFIAGQKIDSTTTGKDGHTPLPNDARNTMILTDFVQDKSGRKEFKYTITVEKAGKKKLITSVNPGPHWYRPDPSKPTYTITAVLDGKTVTEAELIKKGLAGPTPRTKASEK